MTLAEDARAAARARPFVYRGLRAGVINYSAAARLLDVGDEEPVAAALRRYAEELDSPDPEDRSVQVTMHSGCGLSDDTDAAGDAVLAVGDAAVIADAGSLTAVMATGDVDATLLARVLGRLDAEGIAVEAAGVGGEALVVVVARRDGPRAVQYVEDAAE